MEELTTTEDLLELMESYNLLGIRNVWFLQYLLYLVRNRTLYKMVFEYAARRLKHSQAFFVYEPKDISGNPLCMSVTLRKLPVKYNKCIGLLRLL